MVLQRMDDEWQRLDMYACISMCQQPTDMIQHAGFAGAALALMTWGWQLSHGKDEPLPGVKPYENEKLLVDEVKRSIEAGKAKAGKLPRVLVIGALGRCGRGAVDLCEKAGVSEILVCHAQCTHKPELTDIVEVGHGRDECQAWSIPGDHRVRCVRQLYLPLCQDTAIHRRSIACEWGPQAKCGV